MNKWECDYKGCNNTAIGIGSSIGLRAIGWYFKLGTHIFIDPTVLLCPVHSPEGYENADYEARLLQEVIRTGDDLIKKP